MGVKKRNLTAKKSLSEKLGSLEKDLALHCVQRRDSGEDFKAALELLHRTCNWIFARGVQSISVNGTAAQQHLYKRNLQLNSLFLKL